MFGWLETMAIMVFYTLGFHTNLFLIYTLTIHSSRNSFFPCMDFSILEKAWKLAFSRVYMLDFLQQYILLVISFVSAMALCELKMTANPIPTSLRHKVNLLGSVTGNPRSCLALGRQCHQSIFLLSPFWVVSILRHNLVSWLKVTAVTLDIHHHVSKALIMSCGKSSQLLVQGDQDTLTSFGPYYAPQP